MNRIRVLVVLGVISLAVPFSRCSAQEIGGTWRLSYVSLGTTEVTMAMVKVKNDGGVPAGELVAGNPRYPKLELKSVTKEGNRLRFTFANESAAYVFESSALLAGAKQTPGSMSLDGILYPGVMQATEDATLDLKTSVQLVDCPPMQQARILTARPTTLRIQAAKTKDADKKKALLKQAAEADLAAKKEAPKLYQQVLDKHADSPAVFEASLKLLRAATSSEAKAEDVKAWATIGVKAAGRHGPRWEAEFSAQVATALVNQDEFAKLAVDYARGAEKSLADSATLAEQVRILNVLILALRKNDKADEARPHEARVAKMDVILDREYIAKGPGFKGTAFEGRKGKSERAAFMELFTGAACPPCVAADLAFDALQKTYKPSELVLIQYHLHIPGPDPLTNPDTQARWKYYTGAFPEKVRGVPSSLFNGAPQASGGGGWADGSKKYAAYREVIDPLLEESLNVKLAVQTIQKGDRIDIDVTVTGLARPGEDKKLRILLAEETVHYAGSNRIRLHHNVVRAFPGGVEGRSLLNPDSKHKASISLTDLRGQLNVNLDDFEKNVRLFLNPARPMVFDQLRVIAFVQDDDSHEILQAVQVAVEKK